MVHDNESVCFFKYYLFRTYITHSYLGTIILHNTHSKREWKYEERKTRYDKKNEEEKRLQKERKKKKNNKIINNDIHCVQEDRKTIQATQQKNNQLLIIILSLFHHCASGLVSFGPRSITISLTLVLNSKKKVIV